MKTAISVCRWKLKLRKCHPNEDCSRRALRQPFVLDDPTAVIDKGLVDILYNADGDGNGIHGGGLRFD